MTHGINTLKIVVEGTGEIVQKRYAPALKDQYDIAKNAGKTLSVVFVDQSEYWNTRQSRPKDVTARKKFIKKLSGWATYLDKSIDEDGTRYSKLKSDVVVIATPDETHVLLVLNWLKRRNSCKHIFVEKPIDSSLSRARTLQYYARHFPAVTLHPIDHYLARFLPLSDRWTLEGLLKGIGGRLTKMTFHFLEDRSEANLGPIEAANRTRSLKHGLVLDLFPHILAIVRSFGLVESIEIKNLKVAQYTYELSNGTRKKTDIPKETFAHIDFSFSGFTGNVIDATAYLGKGVNGSTDLGIIGNDVKRLELIGTNKRRLLIDLRSSDRGGDGSVEILDHLNKVVNVGPNLLDDPYEVLVEQIVDKFLWKKNIKLHFVLDLQTAKSSLSCIHEIMTLVQNFLHTKKPLSTYHIETIEIAGKKTAKGALLEDIKLKSKSVFRDVSVKSLTDFYVEQLKKMDDTHQLPH